MQPAVFLDELSSQPEDGRHQNFRRINTDDFEHLLTSIEDEVRNNDANCREANNISSKINVNTTGCCNRRLRVTKVAVLAFPAVLLVHDNVNRGAKMSEWNMIVVEIQDRCACPYQH
ncbi:hypothetical protein PR048_006975 [Dryococelus australis]|uniref:Uncharacterized protein n=1 Tax=Dryococelus australis TaxID=614101 RepID=A0ABQ9ICE0_9NEOP|nr:hypothetical protein PR048_006975 [Dryococelus australis]